MRTIAVAVALVTFGTPLIVRAEEVVTAQAVAVRGPIGESDIEFLVRSVLGADSSYGKSGTGWEVRIVGDARYAVIKVAMICGSLCGSGASYTYSFSDGRWSYEYTSEQWIS